MPFTVRGLDLFVTHSPCQSCASAIAETGEFRRIFYQTEYRHITPLEYLVEQNIGVYKVLPAGYITEFKTGQLMNPESFY